MYEGEPGKQFWIFLATILKKRIGVLEEEYLMLDAHAKKKITMASLTRWCGMAYCQFYEAFHILQVEPF